MDDTAESDDRKIWWDYCELTVTLTGEGVDPKAARARAQLDHLVGRRLDAFQTVVERKWAVLNQLVAVTVGFVAMGLLQGSGFVHEPVRALVVALMAGLFAPLSKGLFSAIFELRRRQS